MSTFFGEVLIALFIILLGVDAVPAAEGEGHAKTALLPISEGFEDMEAVIIIDSSKGLICSFVGTLS